MELCEKASKPPFAALLEAVVRVILLLEILPVYDGKSFEKIFPASLGLFSDECFDCWRETR